MCKCTPTKRTPFCGKVGCEYPKNPLSGFKEGDLFTYVDRVCTIVDHEGKPMVKSLSDGWSGLVEWQDGKQFKAEVIEMPRTPLELFKFIREYQYYEDLEDVI